jgi:peptidoglycan/LPS O-acetylase OafA/YrhL
MPEPESRLAPVDGRGARRLGYQPALDGLRALAVLAVVLFHEKLAPGGSGGVTVFFTLSGFLITYLLTEEFETTGRISLGTFYLRRAFRLMPALLVLLVVDVAFVLLVRTGWEWKADLAAAVVTLFYASNWVQAYRLLPLNQLTHTWSLAVEEQFYFIWPVLLGLLFKLRLRRKQLVGLIAFGAACLALERLALAQHGASAMRLYNALDTRADGLLFGSAAAIVFRSRLLGESRRAVRALGWAGTGSFILLMLHLFAGIGAVPRSTSMASISSHTLLAWLTVVVILALTSPTSTAAFVRQGLTWRPLRFVGQISYGLYLWHGFVVVLVDNAEVQMAAPLLGVLVCGGSLALTLASYYLVEKPCLRLRDALALGRRDRRSGTPKTASPPTALLHPSGV